MQLKFIHITFLSLFFALLNRCDSQEALIKQSQFDAEVYHFLGKELVNFINTSDSVQLLKIDPSNNLPHRKKFMDYDLVNDGNVLSEIQRDSLFSILRSDQSYSFNETEKSCTELPNYALAFLGKNRRKVPDTLSVFIDLNCDMWVFKYHDEIKYEYIVNVTNNLEFLINAIAKKNSETPSITTENSTMETLSRFLQKKYGEETINSLLTAETVSAYLLDPEKNSNKEVNTFRGFAMLDSAQISKKHKAHKFLLHAIEETKVETESRFAKNCTFLPDAAFSFHGKENQNLDLLISFYCNDLWVIYNEERSIIDCELLKNDLLDASIETFPNDQFLKKYFNE